MSKVSIFKNIRDVTNPEIVDLYSYLSDIRDGKWSGIVSECRSISDKKLRDEYKRNMPTTSMSGIFSYRSDDGLVDHSGYIALDLDHLDDPHADKRRLANDKYVVAAFLSVSGDGLRVLFRIDPKKHRESFLGLTAHLFNHYEITSIDENGINVSKPYVVSDDAGMYLNPELHRTPKFQTYVKETVIKKLPDFVHTASDFDQVLKQISDRGVNICEDYRDWLKLCFSISDHFGEDGRAAFHEVSRFSPKYKYIVADKQYNQCLRARGTNKNVNISTFYYLAKQHNINIVSEQTKTIVRTVKTGKRAGLNKQQIIDNLLKHQNISGADQVVFKVFDSDSEWVDGEEESLLLQLEMFISTNYSLKMNEVTGYLEQAEKPLTPSDLNTIFVAAKKQILKLDYQLMMRLLKSDFVESYNPFFKFFNSDGVAVDLPAIPIDNGNRFRSPLIDKLAETIQTTNPMYTTFFVRKWIVSIISSCHKVHSPLLLCLLGAQNSGKTEWFRRLLPKQLQAYYAESKLDKEKDDEILMCENIIVMDDELGGKSKNDTQKLKNITSKQYFSLRRPYGDHNEKIMRLAVLCGTSNLKAVLNDATGNRRIIPVDVIDIDKVLYNSIDKEELFREAFRLYKEGFDWRITRDDIKFLNSNEEEYEVVIKERELLQRYFQVGGEVRLTSTDILVELELLTKQKLHLPTIGSQLEKLGYIRKSTRPTGAKKWCVERINRSSDNPYTQALTPVHVPPDVERLDF